MLVKKVFPIFVSLLALGPVLAFCSDQQESSKAGFDPAPPIPSLLLGTQQPKFVNALPNPLAHSFIFKPVGKTEKGYDFYKIKRVPFIADLGIVNPAIPGSNQLLTPMFGFASKHQGPTYPARTILVNKHETIKVLWENKLIDKQTGMPLPLLTYVPFDPTVHSAMLNPPYPQSGVPTVTHLHGGFTEQFSDGHPEAWATPNFVQLGDHFKKRVDRYDNNQNSTMLWYHDHALGFTRLNNYAGLVGAYVIRGKGETKLIKHHQLPAFPYEVPLVIVDKQFATSGDMYFPYNDPSAFTDPSKVIVPTVLPEFFGDFILVNGKSWPYLQVEPRQYRFRVLNGCDSRFLDLQLNTSDQVGPTGPTDPGIQFYQIGTDSALLNAPVPIDHLLIAPGMRADLIVDFTNYQNATLIMTNSANAPYPTGTPVDYTSTGLVMQFRVDKPLDAKIPVTTLPSTLRSSPIKRLDPTTAPTRQVLLFEGQDELTRILPLLGVPSLGALHWMDPVTEVPYLGSTEIWEIYNTTGDAHPIHLHAGDFQILDRQDFTGNLDPNGVLTNIQMIGTPTPVTGAELGLFDTAIVYPSTSNPNAAGQRTRIIMQFTLPGSYVWHCHILSHEDHDMMRPMFIQSN